MNIEPFVQAAEQNDFKLEGVIVYQRGADVARHRWTAEEPRIIYSVSKSFVSVAVGMAISEGKLQLSSRITEIFKRPQNEPRWDSLTVQHLLTMTMGHGAFTRPQSLDEALAYKLDKDPGTSFFYDNTCTFLLSVVLTTVTGLTVRDYLLDRLFRPLGIPDPEWLMSKDGYNIGASGLFLTTSQMALFGRFLLQRGNWEGRQLVPAGWLDGATRTHVPTREISSKPDWDLGYGYQFWTCRHGAFRCDGRDGQLVVVFPALDAVVTINANRYDYEPILWAVWDFILPQLEAALCP